MASLSSSSISTDLAGRPSSSASFNLSKTGAAIEARAFVFLSCDFSILPRFPILFSTLSRSANASSILITSISERGSTLPET